MNQVFLLDVFLFLFLLQYIFYFCDGLLGLFFSEFFFFLFLVFSYSKLFPLSYVLSFFTFLVLLVFCFFGYFSYSFCVCSMLEFTLVYALVAWLSTVFFLLSSGKVSVYLSKGGDSFFKTLSMMMVEVVSEFSRPLALTVRLTVNVTVGHLILGFFYVLLESVGEFFGVFIIFAIMLECFVFFIQSYIFSRLVYLYLNE